MIKRKLAFQTVADKHPSRADHIWFMAADGWKCCLCGAITAAFPPPAPTPVSWVPDRWDALTDDERNLSPFKES